MRRFALAAAFCLCALLTRPAFAACTINSISNIAFGNYNVFDTTPSAYDGFATISYNCTSVAVVTIDGGLTGSTNPRYLQRVFATDRLAYDFFTDIGRNILWPAAGVSLPASQTTATIYSRVFVGQDVAAGFYFDFVRVTFNY